MLKGRDSSNPSYTLDALPLLDVECGGWEGGGGRGEEEVEGVDWDASQSFSCLFGG